MMNVHWKRTPQMMIMMMSMRSMCPGIGKTMISHSVRLIMVRIYHGSTPKMRLQRVPCTPVLHM
jgi:hypothetical protein